jgi:hypothetical protein
LDLAIEWCEQHYGADESDSAEAHSIFRGVRMPMLPIKRLLTLKHKSFVPSEDYIEALEFNLLPQLFEDKMAQEIRFNARGSY